MADDQYQTGGCSGNWWEPSRNSRFESGSSSPSSSSSLTQLNNSMGSFGWPGADHNMVEMKARSCIDSGTSDAVFGDAQRPQGPPDPHSPALLNDPNLQMMGLGLSSQSLDWNTHQSLLRSGQGGSTSFRSLLQGEISRPPAGLNFSLDQRPPQFDSHSSSGESTVTSLNNMDPSAAYGGSNSNPSTATLLQGLLNSDQDCGSNFDQNRPMGYHPYAESYGVNCSAEVLPSWSSSTSNKFPQQLLRTNLSPPPPPPHSNQLLHFSNNAPYWNAPAANMNSNRPVLFQAPQAQIPMATSFDQDKPKITTPDKGRDSGPAVAGKKSGGEPGIKRPRSEAPATLPPFKVRKEKMGDRITALQQLVSPFGKTDTASVLSEAIEYIKFLHQQVSVLSTPYMNNSTGAPIQYHQQAMATSDKSKDPEGPTLRSRGLCLVPISSTFPVTHETTVDFWTPTFGGTYR